MSRDGFKRVLAAIREWGPLSAEEAAEEAGVDRMHAGKALSYFNTVKKQVHIHAWRRNKDKLHCKPYAVYAYGEGENAPKPRALGKTEYNRRYTSRRRVVASVFDLGRSLETRRIAARLQK